MDTFYFEIMFKVKQLIFFNFRNVVYTLHLLKRAIEKIIPYKRNQNYVSGKEMNT